MAKSQISENPENSMENTAKPVDIAQIFNEIKTHPEMLEQFANALENVKPITQPSIILKGGVEQIGLTKLTPRIIEQYLWMHPVIPRGIEIKANKQQQKECGTYYVLAVEKYYLIVGFKTDTHSVMVT